MNKKKSNPYVLITGASSGIGWDLADLFAQDHYNVVLVARREGKLKELSQKLEKQYGVDAIVLSADLRDKSAPGQIFKSMADAKISVEVLVNNAGLGTSGSFSEIEAEKDIELIEVNIIALTHLTKLFLPGMIKRGRGKILNVASTAAFQPGPLMSVYYASKAYVLFFSQALEREVKNTGVTVTTLCPGPTKTGFQKTAKIEKTFLGSFYLMDSASVAKAGYEGLMKGKSLVIPGLLNKLTVQSNRVFPRKWITQVAHIIQSKKS